MTPLSFSTSGKNTKNYVALAGLVLAFVLLVLLGANIWFLLIVQGLGGLMVWEILTDRPASFHLDDVAIAWRAGKQDIRILLRDIDVVRVSKKLDFSHSVSVFTKDGKRYSIPWECLPEVEALQAHLRETGVTIKKSLFSFG